MQSKALTILLAILAAAPAFAAEPSSTLKVSGKKAETLLESLTWAGLESELRADATRLVAYGVKCSESSDENVFGETVTVYHCTARTRTQARPSIPMAGAKAIYQSLVATGLKARKDAFGTHFFSQQISCVRKLNRDERIQPAYASTCEIQR